MSFWIAFHNRCVSVLSALPLFFLCVEGCTLTANEHHGIRYCPMAMVDKDLEERKLLNRRLSEKGRSDKLDGYVSSGSTI